jgi:hypothetical protein
MLAGFIGLSGLAGFMGSIGLAGFDGLFGPYGPTLQAALAFAEQSAGLNGSGLAGSAFAEAANAIAAAAAKTPIPAALAIALISGTLLQRVRHFGGNRSAPSSRMTSPLK